MITGLRKETFQNLVLDAGLFVCNLEYESFETAAELIAALKALVAANTVVDGTTTGTALLGATIGGGGFQATPTMRGIDVDGKRYEFVGSQRNDGWTIQQTGTLKEITPGTLKTVLAMADVTKNGNVTKVTLHTDIKENDYIKTLCWVGDTSKGAALIVLKNALNTAGASMTFADKGEATLPFTFVAHQDNVDDYDVAPVEILFFENGEQPAQASVDPENGGQAAGE